MKRSRIPKHFALLLVAAFLAGSALASERSEKYNRLQPVRGERDWIIRNFDFYSELQRNFEEAQHDARSFDLIEDYTSGIVLPSCGAAVRLLSRGHDMELMSAYFRLLTFTQNDASETFGYRLAQIFAANPALVEGEASSDCGIVVGVRQPCLWPQTVKEVDASWRTPRANEAAQRMKAGAGAFQKVRMTFPKVSFPSSRRCAATI